jgi:phosphoglycerate dehydrogenase-like enzyme
LSTVADHRNTRCSAPKASGAETSLCDNMHREQSRACVFRYNKRNRSPSVSGLRLAAGLDAASTSHTVHTEVTRKTMTPPIPVLILTQSPIPAPLIELVRSVSSRLRVDHRTARTVDELGERVNWREVEVLYTTGLLPSPERVPALRWVQGHFAGVDSVIDHPLITSVTLTTSSGVHAPAMAEYVLMMMLAFAHHLPRMLEWQRRAEWPRERWALFAPRELRGATVGVVGYGSVGREVARLARAFGMRVLATKRDTAHAAEQGWGLPGVGDSEGRSVDRLYPPEALGEMLGESDYVVLVVPLTPATRGLIDAEALQRMKRDAVLINVARGGVVDEAALVEALRMGAIRGAALDVFAQEPLPADSPLWTLPNVVLSPHVSGFTLEYDNRAMALFADNLRRYVAGEPLLNVVDVSLGY